MRSLQSPNILWIHWRVYNFIANTSKGVLFLPPSDAYVRSFLYLLYTLIKLYYTKALSDQASSLALDWILLLWGPRIPGLCMIQQQPFIIQNRQRNWHKRRCKSTASESGEERRAVTSTAVTGQIFMEEEGIINPGTWKMDWMGMLTYSGELWKLRSCS